MTLKEEKQFILDWVQSMIPLLYRLGGPTTNDNESANFVSVNNQPTKPKTIQNHNNRRTYMTASMAFEKRHNTI